MTTARGLSDLRTATSARVHAKPPQKGAEYLNLYLLDKERQRLETELDLLQQRSTRIHAHVAELRKAMSRIELAAQQNKLDGSAELQPAPSAPGAIGAQRGQREWKKLAVGY